MSKVSGGTTISLIRHAKAAAGNKDVTVMAGMARQVLAAGRADEVEVEMMPVLLGGGQRLFD